MTENESQAICPGQIWQRDGISAVVNEVVEIHGKEYVGLTTSMPGGGSRTAAFFRANYELIKDAEPAQEDPKA